MHVKMRCPDSKSRTFKTEDVVVLLGRQIRKDSVLGKGHIQCGGKILTVLQGHQVTQERYFDMLKDRILDVRPTYELRIYSYASELSVTAEKLVLLPELSLAASAPARTPSPSPAAPVPVAPIALTAPSCKTFSVKVLESTVILVIYVLVEPVSLLNDS